MCITNMITSNSLMHRDAINKPRMAQVEWVVLYLAKSTNFESQLPEETQSKINEGWACFSDRRFGWISYPNISQLQKWIIDGSYCGCFLTHPSTFTLGVPLETHPSRRQWSFCQLPNLQDRAPRRWASVRRRLCTEKEFSGERDMQMQIMFDCSWNLPKRSFLA